MKRRIKRPPRLKSKTKTNKWKKRTKIAASTVITVALALGVYHHLFKSRNNKNMQSKLSLSKQNLSLSKQNRIKGLEKLLHDENLN